jgi:hypothetical protein
VNPPGGPPQEISALPEELRGPLDLHLKSLALRSQSRDYRRNTAAKARRFGQQVRDRLPWVKQVNGWEKRAEHAREPPK